MPMDWEAHVNRGLTSADEILVRSLYHKLLEAWNQKDATAFASLFDEDGSMIGFDGSVMNGRNAIEATLREIFSHHQTPFYVSKIRTLRFPNSGVAILNAVAGMLPPGQNDLDPDLNAIQTMVAERQVDEWRIAVLQNTPAAFHGRPELSEKLTAELREVLFGS